MVIWQGLNNFVYIPLFIIIAFIAAYYFKKKQLALKILVDPENKFLLKNYSFFKEVAKLVLWLVALGAIFIIILNPSVYGSKNLVEQKSRDVFVVLDVSKSMLAQDIKPSRLQFTKEKIKKFLKLLPGDRFGLVLFASDSFVQCPLTRDYSAYNMFLDQVDTETVSGGSTSFASSLKVCMEQSKKDNNHNKIIVVFTDGEDFSSDLLNVKKQAQELQMYIFAVGVGTTEGAKIPLYDSYRQLIGYQKDKAGREVVTKLNEGIIQNLATEFNGMYVPLSQNNSDIKKIAAEIKKLKKQKTQDERDLSIFKTEGIYAIFALVALIALLIGWIL